MKNNNGFTLVEAMLASTIVLFVVVSVLFGFTQQMMTNRYAQSKSVAITLAESKIEDYLKFPASQMPAGSTDYMVEIGKKLVHYTTDPNKKDQYRRTVVINAVPFSNLIEIRVTVDYGKYDERYPFHVILSSIKGG